MKRRCYVWRRCYVCGLMVATSVVQLVTGGPAVVVVREHSAAGVRCVGSGTRAR